MRRPWTGVLERPPVTGPSAWQSLDNWQRRALLTFVGILTLILLSSVLYHAVLVVFEGRSPTYASSLQTAVETHTGTGYGGDSPWETRAANLFVAAMDLSTFLLLFIVLPYVFAPVLEEALSPVTPTSVDRTDHVVVCGFAQQSRRLVDELDTRGFEYVVVVRTEQQARELGGRRCLRYLRRPDRPRDTRPGLCRRRPDRRRRHRALRECRPRGRGGERRRANNRRCRPPGTRVPASLRGCRPSAHATAHPRTAHRRAGRGRTQPATK